MFHVCILVTDSVEGGEAVPSPGSLLPQEQHSNLPVVRKKERDYMGMFEYRKEDEQTIVRHLIHGKYIIRMLLFLSIPSVFTCWLIHGKCHLFALFDLGV